MEISSIHATYHELMIFSRNLSCLTQPITDFLGGIPDSCKVIPPKRSRIRNPPPKKKRKKPGSLRLRFQESARPYFTAENKLNDEKWHCARTIFRLSIQTLELLLSFKPQNYHGWWSTRYSFLLKNPQSYKIFRRIARSLLARRTMPASTTSSLSVLPVPEKSSNDKKEYRVIALGNGLRALLISDTSYPLEKLAEEEAEASTHVCVQKYVLNVLIGLVLTMVVGQHGKKESRFLKGRSCRAYYIILDAGCSIYIYFIGDILYPGKR